jgi:signal transduction histidine kinase
MNSPKQSAEQPDGEPNRDPIEDPADRLNFLELGPRDAERLRNLLPGFRDSAAGFVESFYRHLLAHPQTARFLQDPVRVERLKELQRQHLASMFEARWDEEYVRRRRKVGQAHAEVGLDPQFFLGAYSQYVQFAFQRLAETHPQDVGEYKEQALVVLKAIFLDIGLTLDAYFGKLTHDLRHALDMFWKANAELKQFAQFASHDLKTPLATVANLCDEALDEFGNDMPPGARDLVEAAKTRTFRMSRMVDELLASAVSLEHGKVNEEVSSHAVLNEALDLVRPLLDKSGIAVALPAKLPWVWGNRVWLREALVNLLSNAAKFMDKASGTITIEVRADGPHVVVVVADNGPGIPAEELERIFVPFRRLPVHRDRPGSGLGLYFTRNLILQQGGRIWAESEAGNGSRFCIQLRRARPHASEGA